MRRKKMRNKLNTHDISEWLRRHQTSILLMCDTSQPAEMLSDAPEVNEPHRGIKTFNFKILASANSLPHSATNSLIHSYFSIGPTQIITSTRNFQNGEHVENNRGTSLPCSSRKNFLSMRDDVLSLEI